MQKLRGLKRLIARVCRAAALVAATLYSRIASFRLFSDHHHSIASDISVIHHLDGGTGPKSNCEEEKKMNKQMTPAEIEVLQQSFARFAPLSEKATLVGIESAKRSRRSRARRHDNEIVRCSLWARSGHSTLDLRALVFDGILRLRGSEPRYRELLELSSCIELDPGPIAPSSVAVRILIN